MRCRLIPMVLVAGLVAQAQTPATISNPGGPSLTDFPSSASGWVMDFNSMSAGALDSVTLQLYGVKRYSIYEPGFPKYSYSVRTDFLTQSASLPAGITLNSPILMGQPEALALGVTQQQLDEFYTQDPGEPYTSAKLYKAYIAPVSSVQTPQHPAYGTAVLMADIPQAGTWRIRVTDPLSQMRSAVVNVPSPGTYGFQVNNVQAGNVRVDLLTHETGDYFRQEPLVLRAGLSGGAGVRFVTNPNDSRRFLIKHLSVGQGTQDELGGFPIMQGKPAMVRVMLQDGKGAFTPGMPPTETPLTLQVEYGSWSTPTQMQNIQLNASAKPIETGTILFSTQPAVQLAGSTVAPGLYIRVKLLNASGSIVDQKELYPTLTQGPTLVVHPYTIRVANNWTDPYWDYFAGSEDFRQKLLRWVEDRYPTAQIQVATGIWVLIQDQLLQRYSAPNRRMKATLDVMNYFASQQGFTSGSQGHIFVGVMDEHYRESGDDSGLAYVGMPGLAMYGYNLDNPTYWQERSGYTLVHEMGHVLGLRHAPSDSISDPDYAYPYTGGRSAGYGYSGISNWFNREILENWDPMTYNGQDSHSQFFADYGYQHILYTAGAAATFGPGNTSPVPGLPKDAQGTYLMGAAELGKMRAWVTGHQGGQSPCAYRSDTVIGEAGETYRAQTMPGGQNRLLVTSPWLGPWSLTDPRQGLRIEPDPKALVPKKGQPTSSKGLAPRRPDVIISPLLP